MIALWLTLAAHAVCTLPGASDAPFTERRLQAEGVHLVIEVWPETTSNVAWARSIFDALDRVGAPGVLMLPLSDAPDPELLALANALQDTPHEVGVVFDRAQVPKDALAKPGPLRRAVKPYGNVRVAVAPLGSRGPESVLGRVGFRTLIDLEAPVSAQPRMAGHLEGQQRINVVLPMGEYQGPCGAEPRVSPFTPPAADRVTRAILRSGVEARTTPTVRLALHGAAADATDSTVLERWLTEVILPAKVSVQTASDARQDALQDFRRASPSAPSKDRTLPGRLVVGDEIRAVAEHLATAPSIERTLPGDLNPTEALLAMALWLTHDGDEGTVRLRQLQGPVSEGPAAASPTAVDRDALIATTRQLLAALPSELPASLPIGDRTLSSGELLTALASAVRGDDPVMSRPLANPDPHARGLGWGRAE